MIGSILNAIRQRRWRWLMHFSGVDVKSGRRTAAEKKLREALTIAETLAANAKADDRKVEELNLALTLSELAACYRWRKNLIEAEQLARRASELRISYSSSSRDSEISALITEASILEKGRELNEALLLLTEANELAEELYGQDDKRILYPLSRLAGLMISLRRPEECERLNRRALAITEKTCPSDSLDVAIARFQLAESIRWTKKLKEAEELYEKALSFFENSEISLSDAAKAVSSGLLSELSRVQDQASGLQHPVAVLVLKGLAKTLQMQGRPGESEALFKRAIQISESRKELDKRELLTMLEAYRKLLKDSKRDGECSVIEKRMELLREPGN